MALESVVSQTDMFVLQSGFSLGLLESDPVLAPVPEAERHDRWIVVTTVQSPTEPVRKLARMPGWRMVVVGDTKTPADWR